MCQITFVTRRTLLAVCMLAWSLTGSVLARESQVSQSQVDDLARQTEYTALDADAALESIKQIRQELINRVLDTQEILLELEQKASAHFQKMSTLLHNEQGRILAQDPNTSGYSTYLRLQEEPVVTISEIKAQQLKLTSLQRQVLLAQDGPEVGYLPKQDIRDQITLLYHWAKSRQEALEGQVAALNQLLRREPSGQLDTSQGPTLNQKLEERKARWDRMLAIIRPMAEQEVRPQVRQLLLEIYKEVEFEKGKLHADIMKGREELSLARQRQEHDIAMQEQTFLLERQQRLADEDLKRRQDELDNKEREWQILRALDNAMIAKRLNILETRTARQQLMAKIESKEVQFLLQPFIRPGYWQPNRARRGYERSGMSLALIKKNRCLTPTVSGLKALLKLGTNPGNRERGPWTFPRKFTNLSPEQQEQLRQAQAYLIELSPLLVELGYLAP